MVNNELERHVLAYTNGYYTFREKMVSEKGVPYLADTKTYAKLSTATEVLVAKGEDEKSIILTYELLYKEYCKRGTQPKGFKKD